jgi:hypothetical protein
MISAMKTKIEHLILGCILSPMAPIAGLIGFWFLAYDFLPEKWIPICTICGLALGILVDVIVLKKLIQHAYRLGYVFWLAVLVFYSVGAFGFFMGVPVLNAALAIPTGFVVGGKLVRVKADGSQVRRTSLQTCVLTTMLMALVCAASAFFALMSPSTPSDLRGMLGLGFEVTPVMIWGLILVGGLGLLVINWALTGLSIRLTHRFLSSA